MTHTRRKAIVPAVALLAVGFLAIQPFGPARTNPPSDAAQSLAATGRLTPEAAAVIDRACRDCHSNETRWPAYSRIAPTSWLVIDHVNHGRRRMNFSKWGQYDPEDARQYLTDICALARSREMPMPSYTWVHRGARLSDQDILALCTWAEAERRRLATDQ